jgi:transcriptional regulator with XRE-family HTH domain
MAIKLNCNRQKIADLERGKVSPSANDLVLIAEKFNTSTDYLLGLSDVKTNDKDLQFVCDYSGLDDLAIKVLREKLSNRQRKVVSLFIIEICKFLID